MSLLRGKRAVIFGVVSRRSLAYGIATAMREAGAEVALSFQCQTMSDRIKLLSDRLNSVFAYPCDVTQDQAIDTYFSQLKHHWQHFDILVHAVAATPVAQLQEDYLLGINREDFQYTQAVSAYSFSALAKAARPMLNKKGALLALTYLGAERVVPCYHTMGIAKASLEASIKYIAADLGPLDIRVNGLSAGPVPTIAASKIKHFKKIYQTYIEQAPLRRSTTLEQVGKTAVCLCSDWMGDVTGEIIHVDGGLHTTVPMR